MSRFNLPVFKSTAPALTGQQLIARTIRAHAAANAILGETTALDFGQAICAQEFPALRSANCVADVGLAADADPAAAIVAAEVHFARHKVPCRKWEISPDNTCLGLPAALESRGFQRRTDRCYSLTDVASLPERPDLTFVPIRSCLARMSQLREVLLTEEGIIEPAERQQLLVAAERRFDDIDMDGFLALTTDATPAAIGCIMLYTYGELGYIYSLDVHPAYRRQKIGGALLLRAFELAARSRHRYVTLLTNEGNAAAIGLYERAGFVLLGTVDAFCRAQAD